METLPDHEIHIAHFLPDLPEVDPDLYLYTKVTSAAVQFGIEFRRQRIQDLPASIASEIEAVLVENPDYQTLAELSARITQYKTKRNILLMKSINEDVKQGNLSQAIAKLEAENNNGSKAILFNWHLGLGDWTEAQSQLDNLDLTNSEVQRFKDAAQVILSSHMENRWPCLVTEEEKSTLSGVIEESNPGDAAYGLAKGALRALHESQGYMLLPEIVPAGTPRSMEYTSLIELVIVYPNPAANYFLIDAEMEKGSHGKVRLYDASGKLVLDQKFSSHFGPGLVEIDHLPSGVFSYKISIPGLGEVSGNLVKR